MVWRALLMMIGLGLAAMLVPLATAAPGSKPVAGAIRVQIDTSMGSIIVAVDTRRAPKTAANFLAYVDDGRFDGTSFYRAARRKTAPTLGIVQGGISTDVRRSLPPVVHEPTNVTGLRHIDGTISMARGGKPGTAMGNFFVTLGPTPHMDARGDYAGYAAFGQVVGGMDVLRRILALPTGGGTGVMRGQMILRPVTIVRAKRLDGVARPTGKVKPWLLGVRRKDLTKGAP